MKDIKTGDFICDLCGEYFEKEKIYPYKYKRKIIYKAICPFCGTTNYIKNESKN